MPRCSTRFVSLLQLNLCSAFQLLTLSFSSEIMYRVCHQCETPWAIYAWGKWERILNEEMCTFYILFSDNSKPAQYWKYRKSYIAYPIHPPASPDSNALLLHFSDIHVRPQWLISIYTLIPSPLTKSHMISFPSFRLEIFHKLSESIGVNPSNT